MVDDIISSTALERAKGRLKPVHQFLKKCLNDWSFDFASMLAYNLLIALLPIAIILFGILGLILTDRPQDQQYLEDIIINTFPADNITQTGIKQVYVFDLLKEEALNHIYFLSGG